MGLFIRLSNHALPGSAVGIGGNVQDVHDAAVMPQPGGTRSLIMGRWLTVARPAGTTTGAGAGGAGAGGACRCSVPALLPRCGPLRRLAAPC